MRLMFSRGGRWEMGSKYRAGGQKEGEIEMVV